MKCLYCQGNLKRGTAPLHIDREGVHITLDRAPAWVCDQCGEALFDEMQVDAVQRIVKAVEERAADLAVAV